MFVIQSAALASSFQNTRESLQGQGCIIPSDGAPLHFVEDTGGNSSCPDRGYIKSGGPFN